MQLNADIVPIKSLYFESGSKRLQPGEEYSGLYGKFSIVNWPYFMAVLHCHSISVSLTSLSVTCTILISHADGTSPLSFMVLQERRFTVIFKALS